MNGSSAVNWSAARAAAGRSQFGQTGYLVTLTSRAENDFVSNYVPADNLWIGASDAGDEGTWQWVTGPETGTQFWSGTAAVLDRANSPRGLRARTC